MISSICAKIFKIIQKNKFFMNKKLKKYTVGLDSETLAVSFVTEPAIEELFVALKKDKEDMVYLSSNEKHLCFGAILVPDKEIYRNDDSGEYTITFSKESIEKMSQNYLKFKRQDNVTLQHNEVADNVVLVESWIKTDMQKDKSVALGLNPELPVGTWFGGFKVNDVDVWERVKSGELKGFSVEAILEANELNFNADEPTPTPEPAEPVVEAPVAEPAPEPEVSNESKGILDKILELINGKPVENVVEPEPTPEPAPEPAPEPVAQEPEPAPTVNPLEEVVNNLKAEIEALKKNNEVLEGERTTLVAKINELASKPSVKPVNVNSGNGGGDATGVSNPAYQAWREQMRNML